MKTTLSKNILIRIDFYAIEIGTIYQAFTKPFLKTWNLKLKKSEVQESIYKYI